MEGMTIEYRVNGQYYWCANLPTSVGEALKSTGMARNHQEAQVAAERALDRLKKIYR